MITPGSAGDWLMGASMVGTVAAFIVAGHRWLVSDADQGYERVPAPDFRDYRLSKIAERRLQAPSGARRGNS